LLAGCPGFMIHAIFQTFSSALRSSFTGNDAALAVSIMPELPQPHC
jgi:hypothetical protein